MHKQKVPVIKGSEQKEPKVKVKISKLITPTSEIELGDTMKQGVVGFIERTNSGWMIWSKDDRPIMNVYPGNGEYCEVFESSSDIELCKA